MVVFALTGPFISAHRRVPSTPCATACGALRLISIAVPNGIGQIHILWGWRGALCGNGGSSGEVAQVGWATRVRGGARVTEGRHTLYLRGVSREGMLDGKLVCGVRARMLARCRNRVYACLGEGLKGLGGFCGEFDLICALLRG